MTASVRESEIQEQYNSLLASVGLDTTENRAIANTRGGVNFSFALNCLREAHLLDQENFRLVADHDNPLFFAQSLTYLHQSGILTSENRSKAVKNASRDGFIASLRCMIQAEILNQANFDLMIGRANLFNFCAGLLRLEEAHLLNQERFNVILAHHHPCELAFAFANLHESEVHLSDEHHAILLAHTVPMSAAIQELCDANILNQEHFNLLIAHPHPENLALVLSNLHEAGILNARNRSIAFTQATRLNLASYYLLEAGMLNQEYFDLLVSHPGPQLNEVASAFVYMYGEGLLSAENRLIILAHPSPVHLSYVLRNLNRAGLLNQIRFNQIVAPEHAVLLSDGARAIFWERLASHHLVANWDRVLVAARATHAPRALEDLANQILGVGHGAGAGFNPSQSTHTASVHSTVSKSVIRLMTSYGHLNLEMTIKAISTELLSLDDSNIRYRSAKRAYSRLVAPDYAFVDAVSGVTIRQLLALVYLAIYDDKKRDGSLSDAKRLWIEGLYEIQRGYNLSDAGVDDGALEDRMICVAGSFNKLVETLNGIHADVEILYLCKQSASIKFQKLAQKQAIQYLKSLPLDQSQELVAQLKEQQMLEPIWKDIESQVKEEFWAEFKELYRDNPLHPDFVELLKSGIWCHVPDLGQLALSTPSLSSTGFFGAAAGAGAGAGAYPSSAYPK